MAIDTKRSNMNCDKIPKYRAVDVSESCSNTLSRFDLMKWINDCLQSNIPNVENLYTGVAYCKLINNLFPGTIAMERIKLEPRHHFDCRLNLKEMQTALRRLKVRKVVPIEEMLKGRFQDNLRFLQWFKNFYDCNCQVSPTANFSISQKSYAAMKSATSPGTCIEPKTGASSPKSYYPPRTFNQPNTVTPTKGYESPKIYTLGKTEDDEPIKPLTRLNTTLETFQFSGPGRRLGGTTTQGPLNNPWRRSESNIASISGSPRSTKPQKSATKFCKQNAVRPVTFLKSKQSVLDLSLNLDTLVASPTSGSGNESERDDISVKTFDSEDPIFFSTTEKSAQKHKEQQRRLHNNGLTYRVAGGGGACGRKDFRGKVMGNDGNEEKVGHERSVEFEGKVGHEENVGLERKVPYVRNADGKNNEGTNTSVENMGINRNVRKPRKDAETLNRQVNLYCHTLASVVKLCQDYKDQANPAHGLAQRVIRMIWLENKRNSDIQKIIEGHLEEEARLEMEWEKTSR